MQLDNIRIIIDTDRALRKMTAWSSGRTILQNNYFVPFSIFVTLCYILPYFFWSHDSNTESLTLALRIIACMSCFNIVVIYQTKLWKVKNTIKSQRNIEFSDTPLPPNPPEIKELLYKEINNSFLPLYWHCTLCYALPAMSIYNLLESAFNIYWIASSFLSLFILVLLVDWVSFVSIMITGTILGYAIYVLQTGSFDIPAAGDKYFIVVYLHFFGILIGCFFLHQKDILIKTISDARKKLEELNSNLDEQVRIRTQHLHEALSARTEFLNNISHEVRTPLQGILGISHSLVEHWNNLSDENRFRYIKSIADSGDRLIVLVSDLLDLSKFQAGKMISEKTKQSIIEAINISVVELKPLCFDKKVSINFHNFTNSSEIIVNYDYERITQVMRNLLINALKYSNYRDVDITLEYSDAYGNPISKFLATTILIKVIDLGIGIPEEEIKSIFLPFAQSSRTKSKAGGTGLGLALCNEIIQGHQGRIWACNNDIGSTFYVLLPLSNQEIVSS